MLEEPHRLLLPSSTGLSFRLALAMLRERGVDPAPLLKRVGLFEGNDAAERPSRVSAAAQSRFLELAADAAGDSAFGLHLAESANPRLAGLLFYVAAAAPTVGGALALFSRYLRIVNEAFRVRVAHSVEGVAAELQLIGLSRHSMRQNYECVMAGLVRGLREAAGRKFRPVRVTFAHARNAELKEFERFFGCAVEFGAPGDVLVFSEELLGISLVGEDPYLLDALRPICEEAAMQRGTAAGSLRSTVENEAQKLLPLGKARREIVAKGLGVSPRTLSRRLSSEGTSYENVVDDLRRSLALQYVREPGVSVSQIAWLLGYEGPTSFNHAFRRWTGSSPSSARSQRLLVSPP